MRRIKEGLRTCAIAIAIAGLPGPAVEAQRIINWHHDLEDSILSPSWATRRNVVAHARYAVDSLTPSGRERFIDLLARELDQDLPREVPEGCCDGEAYGSYISDLTWIVERFDSPRATPLLAREGIAWSLGSRFQVARAGDAAVPMLIATWNRTPAIRHGVVETFGIMVRYADSTGMPLAAASRDSARRVTVTAFGADEPWLRRAAVSAALTSRDQIYLPLLRRLEEQDTAAIDGRRYVALAALAAAASVALDSAAVTPNRRLQDLRSTLSLWCATSPDATIGACQSLEAKLVATANAMARGNTHSASGQMEAFVHELDARGTGVFGDIWYTLLRGQGLALLAGIH